MSDLGDDEIEPGADLIASSRSGRRELVGGQLLEAYQFFKFGQRAPYRKAKVYRFPFELSQEITRSLSARVTESMESCPVFRSVNFEGAVGYPDHSREVFDDFDRLMTRAAEARDPERLNLSWDAILTDPPGTPVGVHVQFVTEKHLDTDERTLQSFQVAAVQVEVSGASEAWVDGVSRHLDSHLMTARIGGIYRPLLIFRNRDVVNYSALFLGLFGQLQVFTFVSNLFNSHSQKEKLHHVVSAASVREELNRFVTDYYAPTPPTFVYGLVAGFVVFALITAAAWLILPRLVPISTIELSDLSRVRMTRLRNQFSLVVFSLILGGIILPLIVTLLT